MYVSDTYYLYTHKTKLDKNHQLGKMTGASFEPKNYVLNSSLYIYSLNTYVHVHIGVSPSMVRTYNFLLKTTSTSVILTVKYVRLEFIINCQFQWRHTTITSVKHVCTLIIQLNLGKIYPS